MRNVLKTPAVVLFFLAVLPCAAQTISRVSGNGQLIRPSGVSRTTEPLTVMVKDAAGNPVPDWPVSWTASEREGLMIGCETRTSSPRYSDADSHELVDPGGKATCRFQAFSAIGTSYFIQTVVTASAMTADGSAVASKTEFFVTTVNVNSSGVIYGQREIVFPPPSSGTVLSGNAGTVYPTPIEIYMAANGQPIPNVALRLLLEPNEFSGALPSGTIRCQEPEGTALSDSSGRAYCHVVFGGTAGVGKYTIAVGGAGYQDSPGWRFEVLPGAPASVQILSGDNQAPGSPGTELAATLLVRVLDSGKNPLPNIAAAWTVVEPGCLTITKATQVSDQYGQVSARVLLGDTPRTCHVKVSARRDRRDRRRHFHRADPGGLLDIQQGERRQPAGRHRNVIRPAAGRRSDRFREAGAGLRGEVHGD